MSVEAPDEIFRWLLERLREALPEVARQVEEEIARGRRVGVSALAEPDRAQRDERLKGAGSRISKDDLASVDYSGQERLVLLIDAVSRLGSSMMSSRDALDRLFDRQEVRPRIVRFSSEGDDLPEVEIDPRTERSDVQVVVLRVQEDLSSALSEAK